MESARAAIARKCLSMAEVPFHIEAPTRGARQKCQRRAVDRRIRNGSEKQDLGTGAIFVGHVGHLPHRNTRTMRTPHPIVVAVLVLIVTSCRKEGTCPDPQLQKQHASDACTTDCPGVVGCDGKTYCNECVARRNGVRVAG